MTITSPIRRIDASSHQGTVDMNKLKSDGARFIVAKASEGTHYRNEVHAQQLAGVREHAIIPSSYHFLTNDASTKHIDNFLKVAGDDFDSTLVMVDVEVESYPDVDYDPRAEDIWAFIEALNERIGPRPILLYSGVWFWNGLNIGGPSVAGDGNGLMEPTKA